MSMGAQRDAIPNIVLGQVYDPRFADATVHYAPFGSLADFFGREPPAHRHDRFYQLHFVETGSLWLTLDEVRHEGAGPLFFFTPPSVPHAFGTEPSAAGHVITVAQSLVWQLFDADPSLPHQLLTLPRCVFLEGSAGRHRARQLTRLFLLLRKEIETGGPGTQPAIEAVTRLILIEVFRLSASAPEETWASRRELLTLRRFTDQVETNFVHHWTLAAYAAQLHVTEALLTDLCNRLAGRPPKQIVHDRLALEARRLLAFSRLNIGEISAALGFKDVGYFCRAFKRREGMTPSEYRSTIVRADAS
jgi:AraC family 4-hydroxyphenylacetate 3-monooxygenase operon regulatory protein